MPLMTCPVCDKGIKYRDELAGRLAKCPACGFRILLPALAGSPPPIPHFVDVPPDPEVTRAQRVVAFLRRRAVWVTGAATLGVALVVLLVLVIAFRDGGDGQTGGAVTSQRHPVVVDNRIPVPGDVRALIVDRKRDLLDEAYRRTCIEARKRSKAALEFSGWSPTSDCSIARHNRAQVAIDAPVVIRTSAGPARAKVRGLWHYDCETGGWSVHYVIVTIADDVLYLVDNIGLQNLSRLMTECRQTRRFAWERNRRPEGMVPPYRRRSGGTKSESFTIHKPWWRYRVIAGGNDVEVEVLNLAGDVVHKSGKVDADRRFVVDRDGTFELRVTSAGNWKIVIEEPR